MVLEWVLLACQWNLMHVSTEFTPGSEQHTAGWVLHGMLYIWSPLTVTGQLLLSDCYPARLKEFGPYMRVFCKGGKVPGLGQSHWFQRWPSMSQSLLSHFSLVVIGLAMAKWRGPRASSWWAPPPIFATTVRTQSLIGSFRVLVDDSTSWSYDCHGRHFLGVILWMVHHTRRL